MLNILQPLPRTENDQSIRVTVHSNLRSDAVALQHAVAVAVAVN